MKTALLHIIILLYCLYLTPEAQAHSLRSVRNFAGHPAGASFPSVVPRSLYFLLRSSGHPAVGFWIWTPKGKGVVNPKYAAKDTPEEQFKWAMKFYKQKEYKQAADEFIRLVSNFKESDLAPEAQYYAGRSCEEAGRYYTAFLNYQKAIDVYPFTKRVDKIIEREYELGIALYKKHVAKLMGREIMTDLDRAVEIFKKVKENAPFGEYADHAQFMIGECYKKSQQYNHAKNAYQRLADEYPQSKLAEKAKYEAAQCTYLASLRPDYDQELTDEAIEEFRSIVEEKRGFTISEEAKDAVSMLKEKKAESIFKTAQFYERQKHIKSAAIYYEEILKSYPRTSLGKPAAEKLKEMEERLEKENKRKKR